MPINHKYNTFCNCTECCCIRSKLQYVKLEEASNGTFVENREEGCYIDPDTKLKDISKVRKFDTGAVRDQDLNKIDFEGFLSPLVLEEFGKYMLKHQIQSDGNKRDSDNWMKGIPKEAYMKSAWRHFHDWWMEHRGYKSREGLNDALMGLLFNVMGYTYELLKEEK